MTLVMGCYQLSMVGNKIIMTAEGEMGLVLQIHAATKWWCLGNTKMHQNIIKVMLKQKAMVLNGPDAKGYLG